MKSFCVFVFSCQNKHRRRHIADRCSSRLSRKCHLIHNTISETCAAALEKKHTHNCDIISPHWPIFSLVLRKYIFLKHPVKVDRLVETDIFAVFLPALHFPTSESILWPYWKPAGNFTCPETGSPVVPVKFGLSSSWISTWKGERVVRCIHLSKL